MILWQPARPDTPHERRYKFGLSLLMKGGVGAILLSAVLHPRPILVYNPSPSVPVGFYTVSPPVDVKRNDLVLVTLPATMRRLADQRGYVPATVPVLKVVAARDGDEVCADLETIRINGRSVGTRLRFDHLGRAMPGWQGCRRLRSDEVFLFNETSPNSFDGRYFGVTKRKAIIGRAQPL
jgi:conjugative transfer signal peptidase TraF